MIRSKVKRLIALALIGATVGTGVYATALPVSATSGGGTQTAVQTSSKKEVVDNSMDLWVECAGGIDGNGFWFVQELSKCEARGFAFPLNTYIEIGTEYSDSQSKLYYRLKGTTKWSTDGCGMVFKKEGTYECCYKDTYEDGVVHKKYFSIVAKKAKSGVVDFGFGTLGGTKWQSCTLEMTDYLVSPHLGQMTAIDVYRRKSGTSTWARVAHNTHGEDGIDTTLPLEKEGVWDYCIKAINSNGTVFKQYANNVTVSMSDELTYNEADVIWTAEWSVDDRDVTVSCFEKDTGAFVVGTPLSAVANGYNLEYEYATLADFKKNGSKTKFTEFTDSYSDYVRTEGTYVFKLNVKGSGGVQVCKYIPISFVKAVDTVDLYQDWVSYNFADKEAEIEGVYGRSYAVGKDFGNVHLEDYRVLADGVQDMVEDNIKLGVSYKNPFDVSKLSNWNSYFEDGEFDYYGFNEYLTADFNETWGEHPFNALRCLSPMSIYDVVFIDKNGEEYDGRSGKLYSGIYTCKVIYGFEGSDAEYVLTIKNLPVGLEKYWD